MAELTAEQILVLDQFQEDIELFKAQIKTQIRNSKILIGVGIGIAVIAAVILATIPALLQELKTISENMGTITSLVVEVLPLTLSTKSFNAKKTLSKKLTGVRLYEKDISRMRIGILPNDLDDIIAIEKEFARYITT